MITLTISAGSLSGKRPAEEHSVPTTATLTAASAPILTSGDNDLPDMVKEGLLAVRSALKPLLRGPSSQERKFILPSDLRGVWNRSQRIHSLALSYDWYS